jgi:hypothetical protein
LNGGSEVLLSLLSEIEFFGGEEDWVEGCQRIEDVSKAVLVATDSREGVVDGVAGERRLETDCVFGGGAEVGEEESFVELANRERGLIRHDRFEPLNEKFEVELNSRRLDELETLLDGKVDTTLDVAESALDVGSANVGVVSGGVRPEGRELGE